MKSGAAPTDLNARTGLSTPPGSTRHARWKRRVDLFVRIFNTKDTKDTKELLYRNAFLLVIGHQLTHQVLVGLPLWTGQAGRRVIRSSDCICVLRVLCVCSACRRRPA